LDIISLTFAAKRESVFFEPFLKMMENFKKQGKCRSLCIKTHSFCDEAICAAADTRIYDLVLTAYDFRYEKMKEINDSIDYTAKA
jgi:uncharacterized protein